MFIPHLMVAMTLVTVHQIDGREVDINPKRVSRMMEPRSDDDNNKQMHDGVNCVIWFDGGAYLSVRETCAEVRALLEKAD